MTRSCECVLSRGQSVELGYSLPGKIFSFVVPPELRRGRVLSTHSGMSS
jgi:hypothetical protein